MHSQVLVSEKHWLEEAGSFDYVGQPWRIWDKLFALSNVARLKLRMLKQKRGSLYVCIVALMRSQHLNHCSWTNSLGTMSPEELMGWLDITWRKIQREKQQLGSRLWSEEKFWDEGLRHEDFVTQFSKNAKRSKRCQNIKLCQKWTHNRCSLAR